MANLGYIDASKVPLLELDARSKSSRERVQRLKQELRDATQEEAAANALYRQHLIHFARAECLQLAKMMHDKLPVELRDMVYQYLCIENRPIPVGPYYHFRKYNAPLHHPLLNTTATDGGTGNRWSIWNPGAAAESSPLATFEHLHERLDFEDDAVVLSDGRIQLDHSHKPPPDITMPNSHFFSPKYVGPVIAFETQKLYYTRNTFSICNVEMGTYNFLQMGSDCSLDSLDIQDPTPDNNARLGLALVVADHVRSLQIRIKLEHFELPHNATADEEYAYERRFLRHVYISLDPLKRLCQNSSQSEIDIEFIIMTELRDAAHNLWEQECRFTNFLQAFRNTVYMLMYDREGSKVRVIHHDETISPFPRNLTELFALTKDQWEQVSSLAYHISHFHDPTHGNLSTKF
ncbi:hypothetical protein BKA66DRAFT_190519 [Pyrenochaeta sp. MPI-SDFR-AT-0127]|nr:hypothetical protein BKA66DRAFT_190519 [Pyrenochaeta sp. MPI-SDFR-AT-0127]